MVDNLDPAYKNSALLPFPPKLVKGNDSKTIETYPVSFNIEIYLDR